MSSIQSEIDGLKRQAGLPVLRVESARMFERRRFDYDVAFSVPESAEQERVRIRLTLLDPYTDGPEAERADQYAGGTEGTDGSANNRRRSGGRQLRIVKK